MFEKTKNKVNGWLDAKPGRRKKVAYTCFAGSIFFAGMLASDIVNGLFKGNKGENGIFKKEHLVGLKNDSASVLVRNCGNETNELPHPKLETGWLTDFWTEADGLREAVIFSADYEHPECQAMLLKDIGKVGEAFIGAEGTNITAETPIALVIDFFDAGTTDI